MDCPSCKKDVSFFASICPYCNRSVIGERRDYVVFMGGFPFIFFMMIIWLDLDLWVEALIAITAGFALSLFLKFKLEKMEEEGGLDFWSVFAIPVGLGLGAFWISLKVLDGSPSIWAYIIPSVIWGVFLAGTWCSDSDEEPAAPPEVTIRKDASKRTFKDRLKNK